MYWNTTHCATAINAALQQRCEADTPISKKSSVTLDEHLGWVKKQRKGTRFVQWAWSVNFTFHPKSGWITMRLLGGFSSPGLALSNPTKDHPVVSWNRVSSSIVGAYNLGGESPPSNSGKWRFRLGFPTTNVMSSWWWLESWAGGQPKLQQAMKWNPDPPHTRKKSSFAMKWNQDPPKH